MTTTAPGDAGTSTSESRTGTVSYADLLRDRSLDPSERGVWAAVGSAVGEYGWKLHLSSVQRDAPRLLDAVLPILQRGRYSFKVATNSQMLGMLNEGVLGATQVGKFMTIYPPTANLAVELADELVAVTKPLQVEGPLIVTDMHLGGAVYTRYGTFNPEMSRNRLGMFVGMDGEEIGRYSVPFLPPQDIASPFRTLPPRDKSAQDGQRSGVQAAGFLILQALQVHAKGSVYLALDIREQAAVRTVILKEGRRGCMSDDDGRDIRDRLRNQAAIHAVLAGLPSVPEAGDVFDVAGNSYLPVAFVPGRDIGERHAAPFRALTDQERYTVLSDLAVTATALTQVHERGVVHRDISMKNLRLGPDEDAHLLDFEIAHHVDDPRRPFFQGTPGFVSPQQLDEHAPQVEDDIYSFGAVMICALTGCDPQRVLYANPTNRADQIRILSGAPARICDAAAGCVASDATDRPPLTKIVDILLEQAAVPW